MAVAAQAAMAAAEGPRGMALRRSGACSRPFFGAAPGPWLPWGEKYRRLMPWAVI